MEGESGDGLAPVLLPAAALNPYEVDASSGDDDEQPEPSEFDPYDYTDMADMIYAYEIEEIPSFRWMTPSQREIGPSMAVDLNQQPTSTPQRAFHGGDRLMRMKMDDLLTCKSELETEIQRYRYCHPTPELEFWFHEVGKQREEVETLLNSQRLSLLARLRPREDVVRKLKELDKLHGQRANWTDDGLMMKIPCISVEEIKELIDNCRDTSVLVEGPNFQIYYGFLRNGIAAAIQIFDFGKPSHQEFLEQLPIVSSLRHENIVELVGYCDDENVHALAYEVPTTESLDDILHGQKVVLGSQSGPVLSWAQRTKIAVEVARGLEYLHKKMQPVMIHHSIKSSSVLLFNNHVAKLAYFYSSNQDPVKLSHYAAVWNPKSDLCYAPECATPQLICACDIFKSRVYSFGVLLLELLTGCKPSDRVFTGEKNLVRWATSRLHPEKLKYIVDRRLGHDYPPNEVAKLAAVARLCLDEPESRPHMGTLAKALAPLLKSQAGLDC